MLQVSRKLFLQLAGVFTIAIITRYFLTRPKKQSPIFTTSKEIGFWDLNYIESGEVIDQVNQNNGQIFGKNEQDVSENGLFFDGKRTYVEIPHSSDFNLGTEDFSLSAWIKTNQSGGISVIVDKRVEVSGKITGFVAYTYGSILGFQLADGIGKQWTNYLSNVAITDGKWHHFVITIDRDNRQGGKWYIDGKEEGKPFNPTGRKESIDTLKPIVIGKRSDHPSSPGYFRGRIGNIGLFRTVLTQQEIDILYQQDKNFYN